MCSFALVFAFSQTNTTTDAGINDQIVDQETDFVFTDTIQQETLEAQNSPAGDDGNIVWLFVRMIFALVFVVALIYGIVFVLKKGFVSKQEENPFLKKAATLALAPGKAVHVITMPDKAWVVGVSEAGINLIGEITDADLINQMILESEKEPQSKPRDFATILNSFTNTFANSAKLTEETIKKQRLRLRRDGENE